MILNGENSLLNRLEKRQLDTCHLQTVQCLSYSSNYIGEFINTMKTETKLICD